ncbi:unnamed protein product [Owenia fusiformis]|uniref:EGF-like domain-containing protein n=1 Tax=Owenia fusiformis TaxID=6347 RepID=A0A8S4NLY0_OWEFU|nr:unnamed protein product [Owenia fusiformis]
MQWIARNIVSWGEWGECYTTGDSAHRRSRTRSGYILEFGYYTNDGPLYQHYTGPLVEADDESCPDPCNFSPCKNGGHCSTDGTGFKCTCTSEWTGPICIELNRCNSSPCMNNGTCFDKGSEKDIKCICHPGWIGPKCQRRDACMSNPCKNNGTCDNLRSGEFKCSCSPKWSGPTCSIFEKVGCSSEPCKNSGQCTDTEQGYICSCGSEWTGKTCETKIQTNQCSTNPCKNSGQCTDTDQGYICSCGSEWTGKTCETKIQTNQCSTNPCENGGTCIISKSKEKCKCKPGWSGRKCGAKVGNCSPNPCKNKGVCTTVGNKFSCKCRSHFTGSTCAIRTDHCIPNPCKNRGVCSDNRKGGTLCTCMSGWSGNTCEICMPNACKNGGTCKMAVSGSGVDCDCTSDWEGTTCDIRRKQDTPNIVLVISGALGYNDVGFRNPKFVTPVIDALAKEGIRLDNYYVDSFSTAFRASLITGTYFPNTGAMASIPNAVDNCIPHDELNLAERLQRVGYSTSFIGKWHMGYSRTSCLPRNRGFDYFYGSYGPWKNQINHTFTACTRRGNETTSGMPCCLNRSDKFRKCVKNCWDKKNNVQGFDLIENETPAVNDQGIFGTDLITEKAIYRIGIHNPKKRLFLTVAYQTHFPAPTENYRNKITNITDGKLGPLNSPRKDVAAMVNAVDTGLGRIIDKLKQAGLWGNTVLLFTSGQGGHRRKNNNWPLRGTTHTYFEGGIRGLGILAGPVTIGTNATDAPVYNEQLYHMTDWYKTFLKLAGADIGTSGADSYDIWNSVRFGTESPRTEILHALNIEMPRLGSPLYSNTFDSSVQATIRMGDYKLFTGRISGTGGFSGWVAPAEYPELVTIEPDLKDTSNVHLYNIKDDPMEKIDLSAVMPDKVREMLNRLQELQPMTKREPYTCPDPAGAPVLVSTEEDMYSWLSWVDDLIVS